MLAHGQCDDTTGTVCTSNANCAAGSYCPGSPPITGPYSKCCISEKTRTLVTSSSWSNTHGNLVYYGRNYLGGFNKSFALGEGTTAGGWAGVGTNGGTNVAIIMNSCGFRTHYWSTETTYFFAGVHLVMVAMPVTGKYKDILGAYYLVDTLNFVQRGSNIAFAMLANMNSAASAAINTPTQTAMGNGFGDNAVPNNTRSYGANGVIARDSSSANAVWRVNSETWNQTKSESNDATSASRAAMSYLCNYDCATYGF